MVFGLAVNFKRVKKVVVVVIQLLSVIVPVMEIARFTLVLMQFFTLHLYTLLDSGHPPSLNQSLSSLPLASSASVLVVLAFSYHSLQDLEPLSKPHVPPQHMSLLSNFSCFC